MGDCLGITGAVSFFHFSLKTADGGVADDEEEKHLRKSRKDSPSKKNRIWNPHLITQVRECTWKILFMKKKYFVHFILAHHSQNVIFGLSDERAGSLLNIKENTENENLTVFSLNSNFT